MKEEQVRKPAGSKKQIAAFGGKAMMMKTELVLSLFLSNIVCLAQEQSDTLQLKTVEITASKTKLFATGSRVDAMDSITMMQSQSANLGEILSIENVLFIKSYGAGGVATASFRGTEARHTSVLWNGFSINSPSLGLYDLTLAPTFFFNQVIITHGASASLNGTSSLGGSIELVNEPSFKNETEISLFYEGSTAGSSNSQASILTGSEKFASQSYVFYENDKNNFTYKNSYLPGYPVQKQKHAQLQNYGIMQNFNFNINSTTNVSSGIWYQSTHREIPPLMVSVESKAEQRDSVVRIYGAFNKTFQRSAVTIRGAWFNEHESYSDPVPQIYSEYKTKSLKGESEFRYYLLPTLLLNTGIAYTGHRAVFKEYNGAISKNIYAAFSGIKYSGKNYFEAEIICRREFTTGVEPPLIPSVGIQKMFFSKRVVLKSRVSKNFNLPSMNDLYWTPGGNILLKPESAWSYDAGLEIFSGRKKNLQSQCTFYSMHVDDWIQWQPTTFGYYAPVNFNKVHAHGVEAEMNYELKIIHADISIHGNYSFTQSTNIQSGNDQGEEITGNQLIYIPKHLASIKVLVSFRRFTLSCSQSYTGIRYTTPENDNWLPSYLISNARIEKNFLLKKLSINLFINTLNIFNVQYQVIAYRAMPGRYFSLGTKLTFKTNKSN